jgi:hypothetical protein
MGRQYSCSVLRNMVYPALLTTIKTYDKLPSSTVSCELSIFLWGLNQDGREVV